MLLGEYEHTIDDKNRLTLPAKFRRDFEDGCVVTRGLDGCVWAWTPAGWENYRDSILSPLHPLSKEGRQMQRHFYSGAIEAVPDKQGRVIIPAALLEHAKLGRDVVVAGVNDHLEIWDRAAWRRELSEVEGSAEMLPNVLQPKEADHVPVLAEEVRAGLAVQPGESVIDATFGAGGHAALLATDLHGKGKLTAIDRDPTARTYFERLEKRVAVNARLLRGDFGVVLPQLAANDVYADAILLDLGVSSMQLDRPERGFSYAADAPLDMRMDPTQEESAKDVVNTWSERDLAAIFRRYGEERYAKQIARAIVRQRKEQPFERTGELVDTIRASIPAPARFGEGHPAKRVFQALRIAVNGELDSLEAALPAALEMLRPGGRLAVISFHSLEDRIVKRFMRERERGCECPPDFPVCVCGHEPELRALQRRPVRPTAAEVAANPRSSSARLRIAIKTGAETAK